MADGSRFRAHPGGVGVGAVVTMSSGLRKRTRALQALTGWKFSECKMMCERLDDDGLIAIIKIRGGLPYRPTDLGLSKVGTQMVGRIRKGLGLA